MRKILITSMMIAGISLFIGSCTVEKRLYNKGFYVEWRNNYKGASDVNTEIARENSLLIQDETAEIVSVVAEESVVSNGAVIETTNDLTALTVENNATIKENKTENMIESSNAYEPVSVVSLNPVNGRTKSDKISQPLLKKASKSESKSASGPSKGLLIVLCFLIPWLAVGLATNWDVKPIVFNILWSLTCIGGIIHAIIVVNREA